MAHNSFPHQSLYYFHYSTIHHRVSHHHKRPKEWVNLMTGCISRSGFQYLSSSRHAPNKTRGSHYSFHNNYQCGNGPQHGGDHLRRIPRPKRPCKWHCCKKRIAKTRNQEEINNVRKEINNIRKEIRIDKFLIGKALGGDKEPVEKCRMLWD